MNNNPLRYNDPSGHTPCNQIPEGSARDACNNSKYGDHQKQLDMQKQWKEGADVCFGATGANPGTCTQGGSSDELAGLPYALAIIALPYIPLAGLAAAEFYIAAQAAKEAANAYAAANAACGWDNCASEVQQIVPKLTQAGQTVIEYTGRVRERAVRDPLFHNFPNSFDEAILNTEPIIKANGYQIFRLAGSVSDRSAKIGFPKFVEGVYEIGRTAAGIIDHRFFRPYP